MYNGDVDDSAETPVCAGPRPIVLNHVESTEAFKEDNFNFNFSFHSHPFTFYRNLSANATDQFVVVEVFSVFNILGMKAEFTTLCQQSMRAFVAQKFRVVMRFII